MRALRPLPFAVSFVIAVAAGAACDKKETPAPAPTASASAAESAKPLASAPAASASSAPGEGRMRGFHGGLAGMLFRGARDLSLKDDQKAKIDKLAEDLHPRTADGGAARDEMRERHAELAAEIRAGKIDTAKLDAMTASVEKTVQAQKDNEAAALNGLHAALEPEQRKTLVETLKTRPARERRDADGGADAGAWREERAKRRAAAMTHELDLDDAQQKKLEAILAKDVPPAPAGAKGPPSPADMKKQIDAALDAFDKDAFDAKKLPGFADAGKTARAFAGHEVQLFAQLVPILKPEQREKLAKRVEGGPVGRGRSGRAGGFVPPLFEDVVDD